MKRLFALVLLWAGCAGCVPLQVPKTVLSGAIGGIPFSVSSPKDSKLQGLKIVAQSGGLTNYYEVSLQSLEATMNPAVITTTGDAQAKLIDAVGNAAVNGFKAAGAAAGAGAAAAAGKP